jgi:hypothetical protein
VAYIDSKWTCGSTKDLYEGLSEVGETAVASGIVGDNVLFMSIVASFYKKPSTSCIVLEGKDYQTKHKILLNTI